MELKYIKGVGEKRALAFKKIGINNIEDFLRIYPRIYIDKIRTNEIWKYRDKNAIIQGKVTDIEYPRRNNHPLLIYISDNKGNLEIPVFGNSEFRSKQFLLNQEYIFWIKITDWQNIKIKTDYRDHLRIDSNDIFFQNLLQRKIFPIYEIPGVLKKSWIKPLLLTRIIYNAICNITTTDDISKMDTIPDYISEKYNIRPFEYAIKNIHFPEKKEDIENSRKRIVFEELLYLELLFAIKKHNIQNEKKGISFKGDIKELTSNFKKTLNFELTGAQKKVINEIYLDMKSDKVMNRLLQGDVGSGKTIVSIFAMLVSEMNSYQSALMCPTELLAEQHYITIKKFIENYNISSGKNLKICLLIGGQKKKYRSEIINGIKAGEINIIIGTHALIQENVEFHNLGLVIIDEQHKFGVMQRAKLKEKGLNPDVLVMTATPIPRTLYLSYYGDLDISILDELPSGRIKVKTVLRNEEDKGKIFQFVKSELNKGRQCFVVYPIIDISEKTDLKSVEENYNILKNKVFKEYNTGLVHGRMQWGEKEAVMQEFKEGKIKVLVSTTVIEVGMDIPNATIMIIEDAQRYGVSQLHQLRGRVGRGSEQAYCILIAKNTDEISKQRLETICNTTDGFKIAESDLDIRGPGEFYGLRQSGIYSFSLTDISQDKEIFEEARKVAFKIIEDDPQLRQPSNASIRNTIKLKYPDALQLMSVA